MLRSFFLIGLFCLLTRPCYGLEITFRQTASVDSVSILLGDIAGFDTQSETARALASKTVAQAGQPGQDINLEAAVLREQLVATLQLSSDILWSGAASIKVHRNGITIGPEKIQQILDEYFTSHSKDLPAAEIRYIVDDLPIPFVLPAGELKWEVFPSDPKIIGSSRFSLIFTVDGKVRKNMSLPGHFEAMAPVAVASGQTVRGTILGPQHVTMVNKDITQIKAPCLDAGELMGKIVTRSIKSGAVIELSAVQAPPLIKKGEVVKIIFNNGPIFLSTSGVAKADGTKGQMIRVQNINSNKILHCRVSAAGLVEVAL